MARIGLLTFSDGRDFVHESGGVGTESSTPGLLPPT